MEIILKGENDDLFLDKSDNTIDVYNTLQTLWDEYTSGHDFVKIGDIKWATMNVGANSITDYGIYFQWGDVQGYTADQVGSGEGQKYFGWADYKFCSGAGTSSSAITKYDSPYNGRTILEKSDDGVSVNWGGTWRLPTKEEFVTLGNSVDFIDVNGNTIDEGDKFTTLSGVTGLYVADKTDHSKRLFFPAAGGFSNGGVYGVGSAVYYWSNSLLNRQKNQIPYVDDAYIMKYNGDDVNWASSFDRYSGCPLRGIII